MRNHDLPRGDREEQDEPIVPEPEPEVPLKFSPPHEGEGFGSWLARMDPMPTGATVRKTDEAMAATERGECPFCHGPLNEDGECREESCR